MQRRKESSSNIWNSCFHYFPGTLRTNIMTSSQLVCQLYKNPNSLSHGVFGTNYKMSTMSARSWRSYGKIEDHEQFIGIRLHAAVFLAPAISSPPTQAFLGELIFHPYVLVGRDEKRAPLKRLRGGQNPCFHPVSPTPPRPEPKALYSRVSPGEDMCRRP